MDTNVDHARATSTGNDDIVKRYGMMNGFTGADNGTFQQKTLLGNIFPFQHFIQHKQHAVQRNIRHEPQMAVIDPDHRNAIRSQLPCNPQHGSVATDNDSRFSLCTDFFQIHRYNARRRNIGCRFRFVDNSMTCLRQEVGDLLHRLDNTADIYPRYECENFLFWLHFYP